MSTANPGAQRVRTRVAPSPTGDPHVGTAYVALVNYCFARKHGGDFLLRIEDTDQVRSTPESERAILAALHWTGLSWDEGPDVGGPHGPYRQSERSAIYRRYADELLASGKAFRCFCTPERLEEMRAIQRAAGTPQKYDGQCCALSADESGRRAAAGEPFVVRMVVPDSGVCVVNDLARGPITFEYATVDMQVLLKSDGLPTYHLANVVDDYLMEITHVIRGEEWVSSAPKHLLLYEYFGWEPPVLMHLPLLRNPDHTKLSKRKNPTGILFYERMGYLPEALMNFLGLLLAPAPEGEEIFSIDALTRRLDLAKISLGGPVFDVAKLDWINGKYLHALTTEELMQRTQAWGFDRDRLVRIAELARARIERLSDLVPSAAYLFAGRVAVTKESFAGTKLADEALRKALALAMWRLDAERVFDKAAVERVLKGVAEALGAKFRDLARVYYVAMTGSPTALPLFDSMELLGRDICRERFRVALDAFGGVTAKEQKEWTRDLPPDEPNGAAA
ncbi:MAG: glutamate--tRNA ligase [Candidatus Eremiobacteraeota bacterium]|nr:glutamate--tRNA ligase [Candidatus Eremiobacteraeota bacterium]